jgi:hypothetical protein
MNGGRWNIVPDHEIGINTVMRNHLELDSGQNILEGVLVYRIQRRQHTGSDESVHDESRNTQLLIAWHIKYTEGLHVRVLLVEHDSELDEDKLGILQQKYWHLLKAHIDPIGSNWMFDKTALTTTIKVMSEGYRWDIFISEGVKSNVERPLWIDAAR